MRSRRDGVFLPLLLFFLFICSALSTSGKVKEVRLGGLFQLFRSTGQQRLIGFLLAVKEINEDNTILPNIPIKIVVKDSYTVAKTFFATLDMATNSFNKRGIDACIGASSSSESEAAATVFSQFSKTQISYSSTVSLLSTKINSPYFARTCPSDSFQGDAMASLVAGYGWRKVATFANSNSYGSSGISQFQSSAGALGIQVISSSLFPEGQNDFSKPIESALISGARIFVFFMAGADMGNLLLQGHAAGLFGEGTQIIASDASASSIVWKNKMPDKNKTDIYSIPKDQVAKIMKGVIAFTPSADYSTPKGKKFLNSFVQQAKASQDPLTGRCKNITDDDGNYLFLSHNCSSLSNFNTDGSNVDNYASYAYDATYAIARAMHVVLFDLNRPNITGFPNDLYRSLINNVSFIGATGAVNFSKAILKDSTRLNEGDRSTDAIYKIQNFSPDAFTNDHTGKSGFVTVGGWTVKGGNKFTADVIYNTIDNSIPTDLPPVIILTMLPLQVTILKCFGIVLLVTSVIIGMTLRCYRETKLVRSIQFRMQCIMIFGALCGAARVFFGTTKVTDVNCSATMWLSHLAFWMIFAPMMLKTWRVYRIVNCRNIKTSALREVYILRIFGIILLFIVAYLSILQSLSVTTPIKITVQSQDGIQPYLDDQCSRVGKAYEIYLFILEGLLLLLTGVLCYMTKDISGALNEARNNFTAISLVCLIGIITFPLIFNLPDITGGTRQFICSTSTFLSVFCTLCCLHGTRTRLLLLNYDIDKMHQYVKRVNTVSPLVSRAEFKKQSSIIRTLADSQYGGSVLNPFDAVKSKNLITRRQVCKEQMVHWSTVLRHTEAMMLVQAEDESVTPPYVRQSGSWIPPAILIHSNASNYLESSSIKGPPGSFPAELSEIPDDVSIDARTGVETISIRGNIDPLPIPHSNSSSEDIQSTSTSPTSTNAN